MLVMKKITYLAAAILVAALVTVVLAKANSTFSDENETPVNIGDVQINIPGGTNGHIDVTGAGTFNTDISGTVTSITINGQTIYYNTPTWVTIDAHTSVRCTWTNNIVVQDQSIVQ
jgi:hypothetical protein